MRSVRPNRVCAAALAVALAALQPQARAGTTTVGVGPGKLGVWNIANIDPTTGSSGSAPTSAGTKAVFAHGPAPAPAGLGSLHQILAAPNDVQREDTAAVNGIALGDLALDYWTYVTSNNSSGSATYAQLLVDLNGDGRFNLLDDDFLVFEPRYQNASAPGDSVPNQCPGVPACVGIKKWQHWSGTVGGWWSYKLSSSGPPLLTLAHYAAVHPGAALTSDQPALRLAAGGGTTGDWSSFDGFFDAVTVGSTTYDFESFWVPVDCGSAVDDVGAVQAAVDQAPPGYAVRLKGTCDFTTAIPHKGGATAIEYAAVVLRSTGAATDLTIEPDGPPGSATILGSGTQAAFFVPPGSSGVTIRGLTFSNVSRAIVAVDAANLTVGSVGTAVPDPAGNVITGNAGLSSAVLAVATNRDGYGNTGSVVVRYGAGGLYARGYPVAQASLTNLVVAGNTVTFNQAGVPDANRVLAGVDVRAADAGVVDHVEIARNAVWFAAADFPSFDEGAIRVQGLSPSASPAVTNVSVHHNTLGRAEDVTPNPPVSSAAGRTGILMHRVGHYQIVANTVRTRLSATPGAVPGGGIVASDTADGTISGNRIVVLADDGTLKADLGAIGVVDDLATLFGGPAGGPASTHVTVSDNAIGDPATPGIGAQRGLVVAGSSWVDVRGNAVHFASDKAVDVAARVEGAGNPAPSLPATVTLSVVCANTLHGVQDDPNRTAFEEGGDAGSTGNNFPAGGLHAGNEGCNPPGLLLGQPSGSTKVTEGGPPSTYTVTLGLRPRAPVTVAISPDQFTTVTPSTLTFASETWYVPQQVTVTAVDDAIANGTHLSSIAHALSSQDAGYDGVPTSPLTVFVADNDPGSVAVIQPGGATQVEEGGPPASYSVVLGSPPGDDVVVSPLYNNKRLAIAPVGLTFTKANWSVPQSFTVSAVNDTIRQAPVENLAVTHKASSKDPNFNGIPVPAIVVQVLDNDMPGPPAITSPPDGSVYSSGVVTISGTAEANTTIELSEGSVVRATGPVSASGSWVVGPLVFADGDHTIGAVSIDSTGDRSAKALRTFTIDPNAPPPPAIVEPAEGASLTSKFAVIKGTSGPQDTVIVQEGTNMGSTQASVSGFWTLVMTFTGGPHSITSRSIAPNGRKSTLSPPRSFTIDGDTTPPDPPVILTPEEGSDHPKDLVISGTSEPSSTVEVFANGMLVAVVPTPSSGEWSAPVLLDEHEYRLLARASDRSANVSAFGRPRTFFVDTTRPMINIRRNPGYVVFGVVTPADPDVVHGTATDNRSVERVVVSYENAQGNEVAVRDATICCRNGITVSWSDAPSLDPGYYTISAVAYDRAGNVSITTSEQIVSV